MSESVTFELLQDGMIVAAVTGPRNDAWREINRYAAVYSADGPVRVREKRKRKQSKRQP